ncbi:SCO3374 family protein [Streptomyces bambusae]|uniref:Proline-rich protein n=1 Tax=Streptomyces bambusae TaxID=1550616 RepID=A0ABS6ZC42_9ACTN|nr:SCO3374 family protein [Streptomyces bambusae]MBW5484220.1 hypothetical protein [Streptomyces bambusae]
MAHTVPLPRVAPETGTGPATGSGTGPDHDEYGRWYERVLGWPVAGGPPVQLLTGTRFDVLDVPADAGLRLLRRPVATGPVARSGRRMHFLVAAGSAAELDGLLDWLEWGGVALDLAALGEGGRIAAPVPPGQVCHAASGGPWRRSPAGGPAGSPAGGPVESPWGAAVWLRPPGPECGAGLPALPALSACGRGGGPAAGPDLVRLVGAAATECHRARLGRRAPQGVAGQPLAFS